MRAALGQGAARDRWAAVAQERLAAVIEAAGALRKGLEAALGGQAGPPGEVPDAVVASCAELSRWLAASKAPSGLGRAEGELRAAVGTYRNAAYAFRTLTDAADDVWRARAAACATMLDQGDHHVESFRAVLARTRGCGRPRTRPA